LNEETFKSNFITVFLATWVANNYQEAINNGEHEKLNHPPVEDAEMLANEAWREILSNCVCHFKLT